MAFHPDDTGMIPKAHGGGRDDEKNKDHKAGFKAHMLPGFFPGQQQALASQLNTGFGGGFKGWNHALGSTYAPFRNAINFPYASLGGGGGDGKQPTPQQPQPPVIGPDGRPVISIDPMPQTAEFIYRGRT